MRKSIINILLVSLLLACACSEGLEPKINKHQDGELDLSLRIDLNDLKLSSPSAGTKGAYEDNVAHLLEDQIHSIALCLIRIDNTNLSNSRVVAYRILNDYEGLGRDQRYFFYNDGGWRFRDQGNALIPNIPFTEANGIYLDGRDDSTPPDSQYGFNGFVKENGKNAAVELNFKYTHPLHGDVEKLRAGEYVLLACANFSNSPGFNEGQTMGFWIKEAVSYWQRHQNEAGFNGIVYDAVADAGAYSGVYGGASNLVHGRVILNDADITTYTGPIIPGTTRYAPSADDVIESDSYVRNPGTDIISTKGTNLVLTTGSNSHHIELQRNIARVTFMFSNHATVPMEIKDFSLCDRFSAAATYLYPGVKIAGMDNLYTSPTWRGAPNVQSERALKPFDPSTVYASGINSEVFFDAMLYETPVYANPEALTYTIEVGVADDAEPEYTIGTPLNYATFSSQLSSATWAVGETRSFLMRSAQAVNNVQPFFRSNGANVPTADRSGNNNNTEIERIRTLLNNDNTTYFWSFEKRSNNTVRIRTSDGRYIVAGTGSSSNTNYAISLNTNANSATTFTINNSNGSLRFSATVGSRNMYLSMRNGNQYNLSTYRNGNGSYSIFNLYPYSLGLAGSRRLTIPVKAFNEVDGIPYELTELRRNQHLTVYISVTYSEGYQDIEFEVRDWVESDNEISFN